MNPNEAVYPRRGNPLLPEGVADNRFPDPHIKIFTNPDTGRENMYVYVGHDEGKDRFIMRDWYVMFSEDLVHWQCRKTLSRKDTYLPDDSVDCWACDVVQSPWDGRYYLYYSNGGESTGVAVSDRPEGPFSDARGKTPILPKGIIVYIQDRDGVRTDYYSDAEMYDIPVVVLVNRMSASASEILAASVQALDRGKVVGVTTYGKGIVQTLKTFEPDGAGMQYTTSSYYDAQGRTINGVGVTPDVEVALEGDRVPMDPDPASDNQLAKALEVLREEMREREG